MAENAARDEWVDDDGGTCLIPPAATSLMTDVCRVCRTEAEEGKPLIHPCKCSGSVRYVHSDWYVPVDSQLTDPACRSGSPTTANGTARFVATTIRSQRVSLGIVSDSSVSNSSPVSYPGCGVCSPKPDYRAQARVGHRENLHCHMQLARRASYHNDVLPPHHHVLCG